MAADTIPARLFAQAQRRPYEAAYFVKVDGAWKGSRAGLLQRWEGGAGCAVTP